MERWARSAVRVGPHHVARLSPRRQRIPSTLTASEGNDWGVRQDWISGEVDWTRKPYSLSGAGTHSLLWQYVKNYSSEEGSDSGWACSAKRYADSRSRVDYLQWTPSGSGSTQWEKVEYIYDPYGHRIAKVFDDVTTVQYVYDGDNIIAEYDGGDNLARKFIHGPGIDEPIAMIDVEDDNATYYYHYDALGSVVALSDTSGDTVEIYEYSVFGQVAATDANNPNPFMFTGREFDKETGLYYYRARYYNPTLGRFLQTDPAGSANLYSYCSNDPTGLIDPSGCEESDPYLIRHSVPVDALFDLGDALRWAADPGRLFQMVQWWLETQFNAFEDHPGWHLTGTSLSDGGTMLDLVIEYRGNTSGSVPVPPPPSLSNSVAMVKKDCSLTSGGGYADGTIVAMVPLLSVDDKILLDNRAFNRIIAPAIAEVDGWPVPDWSSPPAYPPIDIYMNLAYNRDSWFHEMESQQFKWINRVTYFGAEINYYVGGRAFKHYGYAPGSAALHVWLWKFVRGLLPPRIEVRGPADPRLKGTWEWFWMGYGSL
jgi:RHS repeat-associated protein